ncbi:pyridoxal phosphate-dependent aminotransferase [Geofilum rubicundum]|uniref:Aminotransferase n=1 Tax=Geofilum rubicundum JCM 15548 TaxID=1236989 RepID=A0A0E9LQN6_9BACT|nr:aminotransferase class I/II-fold pyridoxal phosphate-dependent enzyme [Geofilum rubicundum]GAO27613.1 biosynthetic aromatic amino acid aminotransferase alpha [Geofilum rubicundum JCM 15548]
MIKPADRIGTVQEYYFSVKLKQIDQLRQEGKDVINLGIGSPDQPPASQVIETLGETAKNASNHGYQSYIGIPALRNGFANWYKRSYGIDLNPENEIIPMMGSKEAIMHISMAFLNPGDEVLLPNPGYPTYSAVTNLVGAVGRYYDLTAETDWQPDFKVLESQDLSKVKLMWVNYPNMPTGAAAQPEVMKELIAFGRRHHILICNDNPYSFVLNPRPSSLLSVDGAKETAIELNSLSKSHNMAGWRIGMVAGKAEFVQYILRVKSNMDSGMFRPMQEAAAKALELDTEWYDEVNAVYARRRDLVFQIMDTLQCTYDRHQVGLFVWAKIPDRFKNGQEISDLVLDKAHVFITPGFIFGSNGEPYIRISLCASEALLEESIRRIKQLEIQ